MYEQDLHAWISTLETVISEMQEADCDGEIIEVMEMLTQSIDSLEVLS